MGFQLNIPWLKDSDRATDISYAMLAGKVLTTFVSLLLGVALVSARQTLIAKKLNQNAILLSLATIEPFWSTGIDTFKKNGMYSRLCLLLVALSSWGFLSGFLLPIGITRPLICPSVLEKGIALQLTSTLLSSTTFSTRLSDWFNVYYQNQLPFNSLVDVKPQLKNWRFVPEMQVGSLNCESVQAPPKVSGQIGIQGLRSFVTHDQTQLSTYINQVTGWNTDITKLRTGYSYVYYPLEQLRDGNQVMAWARAVGYISNSKNPNNLEIFIPILGSFEGIVLWGSNDDNITRSFTFDQNQGILCKANWTKNRTSSVIITDSDRAAAVFADQFFGVTLNQPLTPQSLKQSTSVNSAILMSHFAPTVNVTDASFGREITCLYISDGIIAYYCIGLLLLFGSILFSMAGTGKGLLKKQDIPITALGWVHFVNNLYHPEWKVGVMQSKEIFLIPPVLDIENKDNIPKMVVLHGNQVNIPSNSAITLPETDQVNTVSVTGTNTVPEPLTNQGNVVLVTESDQVNTVPVQMNQTVPETEANQGNI